MRRPHRSGRRGRGERGAALVEFALILPILAVFLVGILELGMMLRAKHVVAESARAAARAASNLGTNRLADYTALSAAVSSARADSSAALVSVVVYVPGAGGELPAGCATGSVAGKCNRYNADFIDGFVRRLSSNDAGQSVFTRPCASAPDGAWCPTGRDADQAGGLDQLGVQVTVRRKGTTGMFGQSQLISDTAVAVLVPQKAGGA